ncbi:YlxQ family RNA-binding protein [Paenalkalicoccus suaedae]|uniref:YlxQ family RNA-binding protein n=1 Tax=Paenalkalicoccus suaedae TaxID=2592382 RepID=A0A859FGP9_9BACI|nr:YlxQ family RNA-binding protein [Paenalkalicoccus suaedae]QKS71396.1 YlxQ family RNA-binding protein [Paenalkalicoccus suaedae]
MEKWESLLGLMQRARKLITGEELVTKAIQSKKAHAVILAADASENTTKKIIDKCVYHGIPYVRMSDRSTLGRAIGKHERVVIAITDQGFASSFLSLTNDRS